MRPAKGGGRGGNETACRGEKGDFHCWGLGWGRGQPVTTCLGAIPAGKAQQRLLVIYCVPGEK